MGEIKENKEEAEIMMDSLAEFLLVPVNRQFQATFIEVFARSSTKQQAKSNVNIEQEVEEQFQTLQLIQKHMENISKAMGPDRSEEFENIIAPVKAYSCKNDCANFLNKLCLTQAFYNSVNLTTLPISKDSSQLPAILNINDRKVVIKQFQKHVQ